MVTLGKWALLAVVALSLLTPAQAVASATSLPAPAGAADVALPRPLSTQPGPFTLATKSLPAGADGLVYSAPLDTSGGAAYCSWTVDHGSLPTGLQLALGLGCQAQVVGTPEKDRPGRYAFSVEVFDFIGASATARLSITINSSAGTVSTAPSTPAPVTPASQAVKERTVVRPNWAGYVVGGGPYTGVKGTFTVPYIKTGAATCSEQLGEWVGLDGAATLSASAGKSIIQAGIGEGMVNPYTQTCISGQFYIWAWWEILPRPETWVWSMTVHAGDRLTVDIYQVRPGHWEIGITDDTSRLSYSTEQSYAPSPSTAEWIVEATEIPSLCGLGVAPAIGPGICKLDPYAPAVAFGSLAAQGQTHERWRLDMVQDGTRSSVPSRLAAAQFSVAYTGK